jgi:hypothetical protein
VGTRPAIRGLRLRPLGVARRHQGVETREAGTGVAIDAPNCYLTRMSDAVGGDRPAGLPGLMPRARSAEELVDFVAADRAGVPFLRYFDGDGRQQLVTLTPDRPRLTIGRRPGNEVALGWDKQVSAVHSQLEHLAGEWLIADEGLSRNGTFVNGERLASRRRLRDGDAIGVGETQLAFYAPATRRTSVTSPGHRTLDPVALSSTQRDVLAVLCRPLFDGRGLTLPTPNKQIAAELHLSVDAVKAQLRALFRKFQLEDAPQNEKRVRLAEAAFTAGVVRRGE